MKRYFKALLGALQASAQALSELVALGVRALDEGTRGGDLEGRVEAIERELQRWEAQVEAELLRAESKFKQARAAEERTRHAARALEGDEEGEEGLPEGWDALVQAGHAGRGPENGVQPVHGDVEDPRRTTKERLRALKLGL